ncbi:MAG TPA: hypothetical protein VFJ06_04155 [Halococcus sp.]|nr:hypothetical protein [Halococcus sp.]
MSTRTPAIDRSPPRLSGVLALGAAVLGTLALAVSGPALLLGALSVVVLAVGLYRGSRATITLGSVGLFCGVLVAGLAGAVPELLLVATAAAVVSWDIAGFAIDLGEEVGRAAETTRVELVHAGASALVAAVAATGGVLVYRLAGGGPALAPLALLCGAVVLVIALRP